MATQSLMSAIPVLYEDEYLAIVNKPAGLMAHDSKLARGETEFLADTLREQLQKPIFLIHRLDRATSGCLLIAFDRDTASRLGQVFMSREVEKSYLAICRGWPNPDSATIDHALDGGPGKPEKKSAQTFYRTLATSELAIASEQHESSRYALLECQPHTGRFRQIRRHLKHIFHHLIGDTSHGDGRHNRTFRMNGIHRMLLHAWQLKFIHPQSGERIRVTASWDNEFQKALDFLSIKI